MRTVLISARAYRDRGFTLVEIMVVVAILGIMLGISIPAVHSQRKYAPMAKTLKELREVCSHARARAIFSGHRTQVVFRPYERTFALSSGSSDTNGVPTGLKEAGLSGTIHEDLWLEMLDINLMEFKDQPLAVVDFYPNGTCDELTIVLRSENNEWRKFSLEVTTGLSSVKTVE